MKFLGGIQQRQVEMPGRNKRVQEIRINVCFKVAAVELGTRLIQKDDDHRPGSVLRINALVTPGAADDLGERAKFLVRDAV